MPELECEYCFKREKELCSPMVVDLSSEEAEAFLKQQEAVRDGTGLIVVVSPCLPPYTLFRPCVVGSVLVVRAA